MKSSLLSVKRSTPKAIGLCLVLVSLVTCAGPQEDVSLAHPLSRKLTYFKSQETFISAAPGVPLGYLCDLKGFRNLHPGMTDKEASKLYGPPITRYQEWRGRSTVYVFTTEDGAKVEVIRQMVGSEDPLVERWVLRHSVAGKRLGQIVAPEVLAAIPLPQREYTLHLNSGGSAAARIEFNAGQPKRLWWLGDREANFPQEKTGIAAKPGLAN